MKQPITITSHVPAAATAAVVTLAAVASKRHHLRAVLLSYSAAPTGGRLTVAFGASTVLDLDITAAGSQRIDLDELRNPDVNESVTITLASGAGAVVGKLNVLSAVY